MSKPVTISSLVRVAARSEDDFARIVQTVLDEEDHERIAEFFDKLNIPRSVGDDRVAEPLPEFPVAKNRIGTFEQERAISSGIQKYMDRHERKIKWHAAHPSMEGIRNVTLVFRTCSAVTTMRLARLDMLLHTTDQLTATEWAYAREMMNRSYLAIRNQINLLGGDWIDAMIQTFERTKVVEVLGQFYEIVDGQLRNLDDSRNSLDQRRVELTVQPEGYPPVKPPNYFGGDLLGIGPWSQYWERLVTRAHYFRESLG